MTKMDGAAQDKRNAMSDLRVFAAAGVLAMGLERDEITARQRISNLLTILGLMAGTATQLNPQPKEAQESLSR